MSGCFRNLCPDISGMVVRVFQEYLSGSYKNAVRVLQESSGRFPKNEIVEMMHKEDAYTETAPHDIIQFKYTKTLSLT